ncbi:MAG: 16S rRNA (cytosine(1402)-N(4))-methyltransferase RsmH [Candidatus Pacebacteria bacterium]|nr:16S rRNA (cytosine(1402)-N(4))-methyltransferase RsmH [Candidatus Paceibacterota bacterium]
MEQKEHVPVLLEEAINFLRLKNGHVVLDATIGGGGHALEILRQISPDGRLIGIDQDKEILNRLEVKLKDTSFKNFDLINGNFRDLDKLLELLKIKKIDAAIFDLGMNSLQIEESGRGFTFKKDEPLFMNFKSESGAGNLAAAEILNSWTENDIAEILFKYGEESRGRRISKAIVEARRKKPIMTTFELLDVLEKAFPERLKHGRMHFATKTFQALRIAVNDEMNALEEGIGKCWEILDVEGRMAVISFHSLEDRIVKNFFKEKKAGGKAEVFTKKPVIASEKELKINPRARSAKLRAAIKIKI